MPLLLQQQATQRFVMTVAHGGYKIEVRRRRLPAPRILFLDAI